MVVYDASGRRVMGSVATPLRSSADDLARVREARSVRAGEDEDRLLATPFTTRAGEGGVLVVSQEAAPYERSELYAFLAVVVLGVLVVARHRRHGLARHRAGAQAGGRHGRAGRGLERARPRRTASPSAPPTNELAALGETLDHLLDRVASAIRSEQRLTSELAHELRTPLTAIQGSADLALLRGVDDPDGAARTSTRSPSPPARCPR